MKKIKMLIAIGILAVGGGAVAFKEKTAGNFNYCVTSYPPPALCVIPLQGATFGTGTPNLRYIRLLAGETCPKPCTESGFLLQ